MTLPAHLPRERKNKARAKPRTIVRCAAHLKWVRSHRCIVPGCQNTDIEAAHVRTGTNGGTGMKPGDDWTVSLCVNHHALLHRWGEPFCERHFGINLKALAQEFAAQSGPLREWRRKHQ